MWTVDSEFKLFCHVGDSVFTAVYVRIAKYISANWLLVSSVSKSPRFKTRFYSDVYYYEPRGNGNYSFVGCNACICARACHIHLMPPSWGRMAVLWGRRQQLPLKRPYTSARLHFAYQKWEKTRDFYSHENTKSHLSQVKLASAFSVYS